MRLELLELLELLDTVVDPGGTDFQPVDADGGSCYDRYDSVHEDLDDAEAIDDDLEPIRRSGADDRVLELEWDPAGSERGRR